MDLQVLIDRGEELRNEKWDSPVVDMWKNDVKAAVVKYGESTVRVLDRAMRFGFAIRSDQQAYRMHIERISKVRQLLEELLKRNPADTQAQSLLINQKREEAKATLGMKLGTTTFNGPVTFGDNSPANNVQVGELMLAIISEAEETLPEGPEKQKILSGLRNTLSNPTFAAMAGASLPEIIKRLVGGS